MNWIGFNVLTSAWLFLLIPPLVLFYFLKLRRPRQVVPSLFLWRQVLSDSRVNSPFQRFKRNILLWLQLLLLILIVLAAMQPYWVGMTGAADRFPILLDTSASMGARNSAGGDTRLDIAKERLEELIKGMQPDQEMAIVTFSHRAQKRIGFTSNKKLLLEALGDIELDDTVSDIEDGLRLTQALSRSIPFDKVLLYSDGNFPTRANFDLPFTLDYRQLPPGGDNFGISSLNAKRSGTQWTLFARIDGSLGARNNATVEVKQDGNVVANVDISLSAESPERLVFEVSGEKPSTIEMRLVTDSFDALLADNYGYLELPAARAVTVYVDQNLRAVLQAVKVIKDVEVYTDASETDDPFDVVITADPESTAGRGAVNLIIAHIPNDLQDMIAIDNAGSRVVDWQRNAALLQHVELGELLIVDRPHTLPNVFDADFENLDYTILIHGDRGPLLLEKSEDTSLSYYLLFHPDNSTLPYRIGFPIMMANLIQIAMSQAGLAEARGIRTGILPPVQLAIPDAQYTVKAPDENVTITSNAVGTVSGVRATRVGMYEFINGGDTEHRIGVGLLAATETSMKAVEKIIFNELSVEANTAQQPTDQALWPLLSLIGLAVLLVEWWFFQRRRGLT